MTAQAQQISNTAQQALPINNSKAAEVFASDADGKPLYYRTYNYDLFDFYEFNRNVKKSKVKALAKVITDYSICPISVRKGSTGRLCVLDGQHRLHAAKMTGNQIYYRIVQMDPLHIADLQVSSKWGITDWVNFYCHQRIDDYITLRELHVEHDIPLSALVAMLTMKKIVVSNQYKQLSSSHEKIKKGTFKITNMAFTKKILDQLRDYPAEINKQTNFLKALMRINVIGEYSIANDRIFTDYDHSIARKKIANYPEKLTKRGDVEGYIRMVEDLMNIGHKNSAFRYRFL